MHEVSQAGPDDWAAYRDIRLAALADAPDAFGSTLEREAAFTEADWRDRLARSAVFLGSRHGEVLATAGAMELADGNLELVGVWAHPGARGTGLAAEVVQAVLTWAKGWPRIAAWVGERNPRAEALYTKLGFRRSGVRGPLPRDPSIMEVELVLSTPGG